MVALIPFDPVEFVRIAELIAETDSSEAGLRTAVGRLYYAAMLTVRDALNVPGGRRVHGRVIGQLSGRDTIAARHLRRLERLRILADYDMNIQDPLRSDWRRNYDTARSLVTFILRRIATIERPDSSP